jgi:hypothetical protein
MGSSGTLAPHAPRSVGVEEELLIVEPGDGRPLALADEVLFRSAAVSPQGSAAFSSEFGLTCAEQLTCGSHVHVEVSSDEEGVAVVDRVRPWLPVLTAIPTNSPFWEGVDTGYAGYRLQAWNRSTSSGPTEAALSRALVDTAAAQWRAGVPASPITATMLRLASWRASRRRGPASGRGAGGPLARGSGARRQRQVAASTGRLSHVVADAVERTSA